MRKGQAAIGEGPPLRYKSCQATDTKDTAPPSLRQTFSLWPRHSGLPLTLQFESCHSKAAFHVKPHHLPCLQKKAAGFHTSM